MLNCSVEGVIGILMIEKRYISTRRGVFLHFGQSGNKIQGPRTMKCNTKEKNALYAENFQRLYNE